MLNIIKKASIIISSLACLLSANTAHALTDDVVFVRKDCSAVSTSQKCFTDLASLQSWLWLTRLPSAASPVSVHIGPGTFDNTNASPDPSHTIECPDGSGNVSFIGSGPNITKITSGGNAVVATNCNNLNFQDLTLDSTSGTYTIRWHGGGSSRWVNVNVKGTWNAWLDTASDCNGSHPVHYWFSSRLEHEGTNDLGSTYQTGCGESWFYASELTYNVKDGAKSRIVDVTNNSIIRMFGSVIRTVVPEGANPRARNAILTGARASETGQFHMHGGIVSLNIGALVKNVDIIALENNGTGLMHTTATAFTLIPAGTGTVTRTYASNGGKMRTPYTWAPGNNPPPLLADGLAVEGSDTFVETDCDSNGNCDSALLQDQKPHLMVYTAKCNVAGPWFDIGRGKCRGEP